MHIVFFIEASFININRINTYNTHPEKIQVVIIFPVHPYDVTLHVGHVPIPRCYFCVIKICRSRYVYLCLYIVVYKYVHAILLSPSQH